MKKMSGLGRGLDAIFLDNEVEKKENDGVQTLRLSMIDPRADQPRKNFDKEALESLAQSIRANGLFQPILVREMPSGRYQIIAGERRFRASKIAELSEIPAIVLDKDDRKTAEIALVENIQRENLNPMEEAAGYKALAEEYGMTQEELSATVGKSRSAIANAVRLLDLPEAVIAMVTAGEISAGHARALLSLPTAEDMIALAERVKNEGLSVRDIEDAVRKMGKKKKEKVEKNEPIVDYFRELEHRIERVLGREVHIEAKGKRKCLTLSYENNDDLQDLLVQLCGKDFINE